MAAKSCDALLVSSLDEVCWLLNIRGDDIPHCPVVLSYALVTLDDGVMLYIEQSKVGASVRDVLLQDGVQLRDYEQIVDDIETRASSGAKFWLDPTSTSLALSKAAGDNILAETSPLVLAKARKNDTELQGMREAHLKDGVALSSFLCWLEARVNGPDGEISEVDAAAKLETFRASQHGFIGTSFDTIAGSGPNGAIIHYSAEPETCRMVNNREVFLLDSGGQYCDGTTDVTRTMHLGGSPSVHEKECFTRVLQGHIALDSTIFPKGTTGFMIDALARGPLWSVGLDYRHGTGHGVGACLNVHEGPHSISPRIGSNKVSLMPGMIVSNEPGYYEDGSFGIRIENLVTVIEMPTPNRFADMPFYGFDRLTHVPIDKGMVVAELLSPSEISWLDKYHEQVWTVLSPRMQEFSVERKWLWEKTRPFGVSLAAKPVQLSQ
jgi:Xaa-Pro aminopeptidase